MKQKEDTSSTTPSQVTCRTCISGTTVLYWCETCRQVLPDKRCPDCGLKCRKVRHPDQQEVMP